MFEHNIANARILEKKLEISAEFKQVRDFSQSVELSAFVRKKTLALVFIKSAFAKFMMENHQPASSVSISGSTSFHFRLLSNHFLFLCFFEVLGKNKVKRIEPNMFCKSESADQTEAKNITYRKIFENIKYIMKKLDDAGYFE